MRPFCSKIVEIERQMIGEGTICGLSYIIQLLTFPSFTISSNSFNPLSGFDEIKPQATYKNRSDFRHCSIKDKVS